MLELAKNLKNCFRSSEEKSFHFGPRYAGLFRIYVEYRCSYSHMHVLVSQKPINQESLENFCCVSTRF